MMDGALRMSIEKNYFDMLHDKLRQAYEEAQKVTSDFPAKEGTEYQPLSREDAIRLFQRDEKQIAARRNAINQDKVEAFKLWADVAEQLAKKLMLNLVIDAEDGYIGIIRLSGDFIVVEECWETGEKELLFLLMGACDILCVSSEQHNGKPMVQIQMSFNLSDLEQVI